MVKKEIITYKDPKSPVSEMFRTLRTNIQFMSSSMELRTLLITSTLPGEGKSWVAANLAVTFAQAGKKVIIVDADMRKGRQYNIFGLSPRPGLSNYLSGIYGDKSSKMNNIKNVIQETEVENLSVIVAGNIPPNPSELLVSEKMIKFIDELKKICDIAIFDGTPSLLVTDAVIISRMVDTSLIVTSYNDTKLENAEKVKKNIENVGGKVAGVTINKIPVSNKKYDEAYYYSSNIPKSEERKSLEDDEAMIIEENEKSNIKNRANKKKSNIIELEEVSKEDKVEKKEPKKRKTVAKKKLSKKEELKEETGNNKETIIESIETKNEEQEINEEVKIADKETNEDIKVESTEIETNEEVKEKNNKSQKK